MPWLLLRYWAIFPQYISKIVDHTEWINPFLKEVEAEHQISGRRQVQAPEIELQQLNFQWNQRLLVSHREVQEQEGDIELKFDVVHSAEVVGHQLLGEVAIHQIHWKVVERQMKVAQN